MNADLIAVFFPGNFRIYTIKKKKMDIFLFALNVNYARFFG